MLALALTSENLFPGAPVNLPRVVGAVVVLRHLYGRMACNILNNMFGYSCFIHSCLRDSVVARVICYFLWLYEKCPEKLLPVVNVKNFLTFFAEKEPQKASTNEASFFLYINIECGKISLSCKCFLI